VSPIIFYLIVDRSLGGSPEIDKEDAKPCNIEVELRYVDESGD